MRREVEGAESRPAAVTMGNVKENGHGVGIRVIGAPDLCGRHIPERSRGPRETAGLKYATLLTFSFRTLHCASPTYIRVAECTRSLSWIIVSDAKACINCSGILTEVQ